MTLPSILSPAVQSWAAFYDAHRAVSITVRFLHLAGLVAGGGAALAADRQILSSLRAKASSRAATLAALRPAHRVVVPALVLVVVTGILLTAADTETFLASRLYWIKMGLVTLLLLNGGALVVAGSRAARSAGAEGWGRLGVTSAGSLVLWLLILYVGVWLTVAA
jgi:hypothetical protein